MRRTLAISVFTIAAVSLTLQAAPVNGQTGAVSIQDGVICLDIVDREPTGADTVFSGDVGRLFCFTRVVGVEGTSTVTHVWYWGSEERARVQLSVRSPNWRTNSSKVIQEHETGQWRVDILDTDGNVLSTVRFRIR